MTARSSDLEPRWFAVASPGTEGVVEREVRGIGGARRIVSAPGGVEFTGPTELGWRANLWLASATRVWLRLGTAHAREFPRLVAAAAELDWRRWLAPGVSIHIGVSAHRCRLYHTRAVAERVAGGMAKSLGHAVDWSDRVEPARLRVLVRGNRDQWTFSLDSSGERLHLRGWRRETERASLRETLASAVLGLCDWQPTGALVDGMCGAGTFAIEGARRALRIAPGSDRAFAFERWADFDADAYATVRARSAARARTSCEAPIVAVDRDARAVERAIRNAERAGCATAIAFSATRFESLTPPARSGTVVFNPPYGRRLRARRSELEALYASIGCALDKRWGGWRAGVLAPDARLFSHLGREPAALHSLSNGGVRVLLGVFDF